MNEKPKAVRSYQEKWHNRAGFFSLKVVTAAGILFVLAWWGYTQVMTQVLGRFELFGWKPTTVGDIAGLFRPTQVLLLDPVRTEEFFRQGEDTTEYWPYIDRRDDWPLADTLWYAEGMKRPKKAKIEAWRIMGQHDLEETVSHLVDFWKDHLYEKDMIYKVIKEPELVGIIPGEYNMLIIPGALLLSEAEKRGIKDFLSQGGGVLMCWSPGTRDERGNWIGFDFLTQIVGGNNPQSVEDSTGGTSIILRSNNPMTAMIPPGTHLDYYTYNGFVTLNIVERRTNIDAFWFSPYWKSGSTLSRCSIAHGNYLDGRFVWFNFMPEVIHDSERNNAILSNLVDNALAWLHGEPVVNVKVWPSGYTAGGALLLEAKGNGKYFQRVIDIVNNAEITPDLIVERDVVPLNFTIGDLLIGDIILASSSPTQLIDLPIKDQAQWLDFYSGRLQKILGRTPVGLFPAGWDYDKGTLRGAVYAGINFVMAEPDPRSYGPESRQIKAGEWWQLWNPRSPLATCPKAQLTMQEWRKLKGVRGSWRLLQAMEYDMRRIRYAGGMYLGIVDPSALIEENAIGFPVKLAARMDSLGLWRASTETLMRRFSACQDIQVSSNIVTGSRLRINLTNTGKIDLVDLVFQVFLLDSYDGVSIISEVVGMRPTNVEWNKRQGVCTFVMPRLNSKDNATLFLDVYSGEQPIEEDTRTWFQKFISFDWLRRVFGSQ